MTKKIFILMAFVCLLSMAFISSVSAEEKIVLLAMDDFQVWWLENIQDYIVQRHIDNNIPVTLGVIPSGIEDPWGGDRLKAKIQDWSKVSTIDVAQHGYDHNVSFEGMSYSSQYNDISKGKNLMNNVLVYPKSFIPPFGSADDTTIQVLRDLGFHTCYDPIEIEDITPTTNPLIIQDQILLCQNDRDGNDVEGKNCVFKDYNIIKSQIDQKIQQYEVALVLYHMQDFEGDNRGINTSKADQVINYAAHLKQDGYTLMTVEQYYQYKNNVCTPEPVSTTCGTAVCGNKTNNCNQTVSCGTCNNGYSCQAEQCIADCIPTTEICDGKDNDCDLLIDEDYVFTPTSCGVGACFAQGQLMCVNGSTQNTCTPGSPTAEVCNNIDDDCNGQTDENLGNTTCGVGACQVTFDNCIAGVSQICIPKSPIAEIWDGVDNDCDGSVDEDGFIGNESMINSTINNLNINRENNTVQFKEENNILIEFEFNLTNHTINLSNLFIEKQSNNSNFAYLIIKGLDLASQNQTKTVYLDRILNGTGLCIKDQEIANISEISEKCKAENETWIACPGLNGQYLCNLTTNNTQYIITGLKHSGVKEQATFCGDGVCNGGESCSSCSNDCGVCSSSENNNNGGSGGRRGGVTIKKATNQTNMIIQTTQPTQEERGQGEIETIGNQEGASAGITGAVIGTTKQKVTFAIIFVMVLGIFIMVLKKVAFLLYNLRKKRNKIKVA